MRGSVKQQDAQTHTCHPPLTQKAFKWTTVELVVEQKCEALVDGADMEICSQI